MEQGNKQWKLIVDAPTIYFDILTHSVCITNDSKLASNHPVKYKVGANDLLKVYKSYTKGDLR